MRSMLALVVAVVMVVAALLIRNAIDDDGDGNGGGSARLLCATELADACAELDELVSGLDVTTESVRTTFDRLANLPNDRVNDPGFDGWLVLTPWPAMVDAARAQEQLRPLFETDASTLGRSPLVIMVRDDRAGVLATSVCGGAVSWRCLGDIAGSDWSELGGDPSWGRVRVSNGDPTTTATGLDVVAQAAGQFFGGPDYFRDNLEQLDFQTWFGRLERSAPPSSTPALDMLGRFPASVYDAAGTIEAEAGPALERAAPERSDAFRLLYPEPVATADVVLALTTSPERDADIEELADRGDTRDALAGAGWRVRGEPLGPGLDRGVQLDDATNLPTDPGVYLALQETWAEVT